MRTPTKSMFPPCLRRLTTPLFGAVGWLALLSCALVFPKPAVAADALAPGAIEGNVVNGRTGDYVLNARITVAGTGLEVFTDAAGTYALPAVPAGPATLTVFFTGEEPLTRTVDVQAGQTSRADFTFGKDADGEDVVVLSAFTVISTKETNAHALALNEQRFAANLKDVVSSDEFGAITEGNVGEFVKYLPGVTIDYNAADARTIAVRGMPDIYTSVSVDGNRMASAASSNTTRVFELEQVSLNNVARVEVFKVPTPDTPADTLGGGVNLITKSAFEKSKPEMNYRIYTSINSRAFTLDKTPGPGRNPSRKITPGFDFSYVNPVTKDFGIVVNGLYSQQYNIQWRSEERWVPTVVGQAGVPVENPYLRRWNDSDSPKFTTRRSLGARADWRVAKNHVFSLGVQYNTYDSQFGGTNVTWDTGSSPTEWGRTFTHGRPDEGTININTNFRDKYGNTVMPTLKYRYEGRNWKFDGGVSYSRSENHYRDLSNGHGNNVNFRINDVTVNFDDVTPVRPWSVSSSVDGFRLANYYVRQTSQSENDSVDLIRGAHANLTRELDMSVPVTLKAGVDIRQNTRDIVEHDYDWTYVGADGETETDDDNAAPFLDPTRRTKTNPFGLGPFEWPSAYLIGEQFNQHPEYFTMDETGEDSRIALDAANSLYIRETISSAYVRADVKLLENRLWLVGGFRYERTADAGQGPVVDPTAIYQRNADGSFVVDSNGDRVLVTTDPVEQDKLIYQTRAANVSKSYDGIYPSLNAVFNFTDNTLLRFGFAQTIGRPNFSTIIPGTEITGPGESASFPNGLIEVRNPALEPWEANSWDLTFEHYLPGGIIGAGVFRKDIKNFFGTTTSTPDAAELAGYGLDPDTYAGYELRTQFNTSGTARVSGVEFRYNQRLTFLPGWAEGISVFGNATFLNLRGDRSADFTGFVKRGISFGLGYNHGRLSSHLRWNYKGLQRRSRVTGSNIAPDTYEYAIPRMQLDLDVTYTIRSGLSLFASARNVNNGRLVYERYAPATPDYARTFRYNDYGVQIVMGVRGQY